MRILSNWSFGNFISLNDIKHLDLVVNGMLNVGMEIPEIEVSLDWGVNASSLNMFIYFFDFLTFQSYFFQ